MKNHGMQKNLMIQRMIPEQKQFRKLIKELENEGKIPKEFTKIDTINLASLLT